MKKKYLVFFAIIAASLAVAAVSLFSQSIRLDESQSIWVSTKSVPAILQMDGQDVLVPLYSILLHFWMQILGTDIIIVRLLSLVFFIATLAVLYQLAKEASGENVAILTITLFSLSPFIMWYSAEARMYTLFTFITCLSHLFFLRMLRSDGKHYKAAYFASTVVGLYTHYFFIFIIASQAIYATASYVKDLYVTRASLWHWIVKSRFLKQYYALLAAAALFFIPWVAYVVSLGSASNTQPLLAAPTSYNLIQLFVNFIFGFQSNYIQSLMVSLWPLSIFLLFFAFTQKRHFPLHDANYFIALSFLPIVIVFAASFIKPIFLSRYLIITTPTLFLLLAWTVVNYTRRLVSGLTIGLIVLMFGFLLYQYGSTAVPVKEDYRSVAQYLSRNARPDDIVAVTAPFTIYPMEYSYSGYARIDTIPLWDRYRVGAIPPFTADGLKQQIAGYKKNYSYLWVVFSYDQGYEADIRHFLDTNLEMKKNVQFSPGMRLIEYRLRYY